MNDKKHHVGLIVRSPDPKRVEELMWNYAQRFRQDFFASAPPREKPERLKDGSIVVSTTTAECAKGALECIASGRPWPFSSRGAPLEPARLAVCFRPQWHDAWVARSWPD